MSWEAPLTSRKVAHPPNQTSWGLASVPTKRKHCILALGTLVVLSVISAQPYHDTKPSTLRREWSLRMPWCCSVRAVQDVSGRTVALFDGRPPAQNKGGANLQAPALVLWRIGDDAASSRISLTDFVEFEKQRPPYFASDYPGGFRFVPGSHSVAGLQPPWLVLIDTSSGKEIRRQKVCAPSKEFGEPAPANANALPRGRMILAVNSTNGSLAVACNLDATTLHVFESGLVREIWSTTLPSQIRDLEWPKQGNLLAALLSPTPKSPGEGSSSETRITVFDSVTAKEVERLSTEAADAKVTFNSNRNSLYAFCQGAATTGTASKTAPAVLCEFEVRTGVLLRKFEVKDSGPSQNLAASPDGRLIAIRTAVPIYPPRFMEQITTTMESGFVLLDADTGREIARESRKATASTHDSLPLMFTNDGKLLLVGYEGDGRSNFGELVAYDVPGQ